MQKFETYRLFCETRKLSAGALSMLAFSLLVTSLLLYFYMLPIAHHLLHSRAFHSDNRPLFPSLHFLLSPFISFFPFPNYQQLFNHIQWVLASIRVTTKRTWQLHWNTKWPRKCSVLEILVLLLYIGTNYQKIFYYNQSTYHPRTSVHHQQPFKNL